MFRQRYFVFITLLSLLLLHVDFYRVIAQDATPTPLAPITATAPITVTAPSTVTSPITIPNTATVPVTTAAILTGTKDAIKVSSKEFTEQLLLGKMLLLMLKDAGYPVEDKTGIGGSPAVRAALESGEVD